MSIDIILLIVLLAFAIGCVYSTRLIFSAVSLAAASVVTTLLMFRLNSPFAAVFELSVCAGLITVIFISVISMVKPLIKEEIDVRKRARSPKYVYLPVLLLISGLLLLQIPVLMNFKLPEIAAKMDVRTLIWNERHADLIAQVIIFIAGAFGIIVLFKENNKND